MGTGSALVPKLAVLLNILIFLYFCHFSKIDTIGAKPEPSTPTSSTPEPIAQKVDSETFAISFDVVY